MELSIIITSYKNPDLTKVCIDSIRRNYSSADYEILAADSETEEETRLMMREDYPEIKFFPSEKMSVFKNAPGKASRPAPENIC